MAGAWRKAMAYLGLVDDDEFAYDDVPDDEYYNDDYEAEPEPPARPVARAPRAAAESGAVTVVRPAAREERAPARPSTRASASDTPAVRAAAVATERVHVMEPTGFNDAQEVGDRLKAEQPVILNLQHVDRDLQRRLIDFSSGLAYALGGRMAKAAEQVFLLTPSNVSVSDEEKERLTAEGLYRA